MFSGRLSRFADEIAREEKAQVFAIRIDCSDSKSVREAFEGVLSLGFLEVLVYNAYQPVSWHPTNFTDIKIDSFEQSLAVSSLGAFLCAQQVPLPSFPYRSPNRNIQSIMKFIICSCLVRFQLLFHCLLYQIF